MKCLTWNTEWAGPESKPGRLIAEKVRDADPDVVCYTEVTEELIPDGHVIWADADYEYPNEGDRRKVVLWSRYAWQDRDTLGDEAIPSGRFVSGVTTGIGFVGVCIPWRDAHVRTGRRDRSPWEDHLTYCSGLQRVLGRYGKDDTPVCVLGDFNQRMPRLHQPQRVADALIDALPGEITIATAGLTDPEGKQLIDHIGVSRGISISVDRIIPRFTEDGTRLSDHVGVLASINATKANKSE